MKKQNRLDHFRNFSLKALWYLCIAYPTGGIAILKHPLKNLFIVRFYHPNFYMYWESVPVKFSEVSTFLYLQPFDREL